MIEDEYCHNASLMKFSDFATLCIPGIWHLAVWPMIVFYAGGFASPFPLDENGFSIINPSPDSRVVYVSSSTGDDANDGLSPETPKRTISAGNALLRDHFPDHLLLKRGDVFEASGNNVLSQWKNGRSADEPMVLSYYGDSGPRPVIIIRRKLVDHRAESRHYQAFVGLDIYKANSDPDSSYFESESSAYGMRFYGGGRNILVEDCVLRFNAIVFESYLENAYYYPVVRRNIIHGNWIHGSSLTDISRIWGLVMIGVRGGYLIEENVLDYNGWNSAIVNAGANMVSHNLYIQYSNVEGGVIRGNILARGSSHGIVARSGGIVDANLMTMNAIGLSMGGLNPPTVPAVNNFPNRSLYNVVLNGRRMDPNDGSSPRTTAVWGISLDFFNSRIEENIIANRLEDGAVGNFQLNNGATGEFIENIVYNWVPAQDTFNPNWQHPDADMGDFYAAQGGTNDRIAYLDWVRSRPLGEFPREMSAYGGIEFIREGFRTATQNYLDIYPPSRSFSHSGGSQPIEIITDQSWAFGDLPSWVTLDTSSGSGDGQIVLNIDANSGAAREAHINVSSGSFSRELHILQGEKQVLPYLGVYPVSASIPGAGNEITITVATNGNWTAESSSPWYTFEPSSGSGDSLITVRSLPDAVRNARGPLTIQSADMSRSVLIIQGDAVAEWAGFPVINDQQDVETGQGFLGRINVTNEPWIYSYNLGWYLYLEESWVNDSFTWFALANTSPPPGVHWLEVGDDGYLFNHNLNQWLYRHSDGDDPVKWMCLLR